MIELFLNFKNENGEEQSILVEQEEFVVGRHSENDLSIVNSKLSRQHIKIQRFADVFIVSDLNSSNGTKINDAELDEPVALKNGDVLNLGGGLKIEVELISDDPNASSNNSEDDKKPEAAKPAASVSSASSASISSNSNSSPNIFKSLILASVLGLFLLFVVVGGMFVIGGNSNKEVAENDRNSGDFISSNPREESDETDNEEINSSNNNVENNSESPVDNVQVPTNETIDNSNADEIEIPTETDNPTPTEENDSIGKTRSLSFKFMRQIARSNQKPVLLSKQLSILDNKIGQFKSSQALANNIKNAQSNASEIKQLANSKNLQPQFLAVAAIAKLGNNSGNVLAKAREMAGVLDDLQIQIGDEKADDSLITIAAYDQGERGDFLQMRNTLQRLADQNPNRASEIRTIWFLKDKSVISDAQFEFALRFLAIGTITQNPEDFNVNAKALSL